MRKLLFLLFVPALSFGQNTPNAENTKTQIVHGAYNLAKRLNMEHKLDKVIKPVLDSAVFDEYYTNPNEYYTFYKYHYVYDVNWRNSLTYLWIYDFQDDTMARTEHTYDALHKLTQSETYQKDETTGWEKNGKQNFIYDANGLLTHVEDSTYDTGTSAYESYLMLDYTYDGSNNITEIFATFTDNATTTYGDQKITFTYNTDGTLKQEIVEFENAVTTVFYDVRIYDFDYVGSNSTTTHLQEEDFVTKIMSPNGKIEKFYDLTQNKSDLILPITPIYSGIFQIIPENPVGSYVNRLDSLNLFNADNLLSDRMIYYYNDKNVVGTKINTKQPDLIIAPNPTSGLLTVSNFNESLSISVYDTQGKEMPFTQIGNQLDLSSFENGIYFVRIVSADFTTSKTTKVVLMK